MRMTINTSEAQSFELAAPGPYHMTIDKIGDPERSNSEKKTLGTNIEFAFTDPDLAQRCGRIRRFYPLEGKGAGFFADLYKTVTGNELPLGKDGGEMDVDTDELLGKTVLVNVDNEKSNKPGDDRVFNTAKSVTAA